MTIKRPSSAAFCVAFKQSETGEYELQSAEIRLLNKPIVGMVNEVDSQIPIHTHFGVDVLEVDPSLFDSATKQYNNTASGIVEIMRIVQSARVVVDVTEELTPDDIRKFNAQLGKSGDNPNESMFLHRGEVLEHVSGDLPVVDLSEVDGVVVEHPADQPPVPRQNTVRAEVQQECSLRGSLRYPLQRPRHHQPVPYGRYQLRQHRRRSLL